MKNTTVLSSTTGFMKRALSRRGFLGGAAAVAAVAGLSACSGGESSSASKTKIVRFGQTNAKNFLDMQVSTSSQAASVADTAFEAPLRWTEDLVLEPVLFTEIPQPEADGVTYNCTLKSGVKFHDGTELKASDIKFTFERMFDPATKAKSTYMYDIIVGAKEKLAGQASEVAGVKVVDDTHITFVLKAPMSSFVNNLGISYAHIFPEAACTKAGADWGHGTNVVGTGRYKIVENDDTTTVKFERFDDYHGTKANLDKVVIKYIDDFNTKLMSFKNGDIDYADLDATLLNQYKNDPDVKDLITQYTPLGTQFINLNLNDPALQDVRVRQALSLAIDRQTLVDTVANGAGVPASGFLNLNVPGFDKSAPVFEYNVEKAKQLLAEAGATNLKLTCKLRAAQKDNMIAVQGYWKEIGVDCDVQVIDAGVWSSDWAAGNLQITQLGWFPLYPDADNQMYSYFYSGNAKAKSSFYNNAQFDQLVTEARQTTDQAKRAELYKEADNIMSRQDYACIPLFYPKFQFVAKDYVKNAKVGNLIYHMLDLDVDTTKSDYEGKDE